MVRKVGLIIQAHMGSERLPGKVIKTINGISVLGYVITRLRDVQNADYIIVATSTLPVDDIIEKESLKYGALVFRGDDTDVLARFYGAAKKYELEVIARICSDNLFIDPDIVQEEISIYSKTDYDIVTSGTTIPLGLGTEVFSFQALEEAHEKATLPYEHEHVTPYIYGHGVAYYSEIESDGSKYRLTLDTTEDWEFINEISSRVNPLNCRLSDIMEVLVREPKLLQINKDVVQRL